MKKKETKSFITDNELISSDYDVQNFEENSE